MCRQIIPMQWIFLPTRLVKAKKANMQKKIFTPNDEQFPVFAWIALALLIIDLLVSDKKISWLINTNFLENKHEDEKRDT